MKVEDDDDDAEHLRTQMRKQEAEIARLVDQKIELKRTLSTLEAKVYPIIPATRRTAIDSPFQIAGHSEDIREHPSFTMLADLIGSLMASVEEAQEEKTRAETSAAQNASQLQLAKSQEIVGSSFHTFTRKSNIDGKFGVEVSIAGRDRHPEGEIGGKSQRSPKGKGPARRGE